MHDIKPSKTTDPPEHCTPSVGLGAGGAGLPHPGPAGPALKSAVVSHAQRVLAVHVAASLLDGHASLVAQVLGLTPADTLHALQDVVWERRRRADGEAAPAGVDTPAPGG